MRDMQMVRGAIAILILVLTASTAHAKRVALVVGINKYDNLPRERQLAKAVNDARAMEAALKAVGFDVIKAEDVGRSAFNQAWQQLLNKLAPGDEVAVFFSGHGVEIEGGNYLVPRDVPAVGSGEARRLKNESLSFDEMRRDLAAHGPKLGLFILDACRDNPFTDTRGRSIGGAKGLVPVQAEQGSFIMFAAGARESALDRLDDADRDPNSIYTRKLLPLLKQPGLRLPDVAQRVRGEVRQLANTVGHRQSPAYYDEGADDVCLAGCIAAQPQVSEAERTWPWIKDTNNQSVLENFIKQFGNTTFGEEAKRRLAELRKQEVAVIAPPQVRPTLSNPDQPPAPAKPTTPASHAPPPTPFASPQTRVRWKMQSAFASSLTHLGPSGLRFSKDIERISGGKFEVKFFEPGALIPPLECFDAVSKGSIESCWTTPGYHTGKYPALAFFTTVPFGPPFGEFLAWKWFGDGNKLRDQIYAKHDLVAVDCFCISPETSGWFRNEVKSAEALKGLKMRFFGLGAQVMQKLGVSTQLLAAADIYPALERGVIDATEFSLPVMDIKLGFHQVAKFNYFPGWHQQVSCSEFLMNKKAHDALPEDYKAMIEVAARRQVVYTYTESEAMQFAIMAEMRDKHNVQIRRWDDKALAAFEKAWLEVMKDESAKDPLFKKVADHYLDFRKKYAIWGASQILKPTYQ